MKKFLALTLATLMILTFVSCGSSSNEDSEYDYIQDSNNNNNNNIEEPPVSGDSKNKIDMSKVTDSSGFSEGKAWVRFGKITSKEYSTIHCINKNGEILFSVKQTVLNDPSDFYNGIAIIPMSIEGDFICDICDENGNITKPSDVGADEFLINPDFENDIEFKLFQDGYVLAKKTETTFNSSSEKLAIFNSRLEPLADYSAELYQLYEQFGGTYYDGYLISKEKGQILNFRTGKIVDNPTEVLASFNPEYASDLWDREGECYYDILSGTKALDLSQYSETIHKKYDFEGGLAPIVFKSADKFFFTVINEDGTFCYDPIELAGHFGDLYACQGKYVIMSEKHLETFDKTGKIAEFELTNFNPYYVSIGFSNDVIHINDDTRSASRYFTYDFKPLF